MTTPYNRALDGAVLPTFFYYAIPSLFGLLAISTAGVVDGIFVGRYLGANALAAINLLIPYFTFMFAIALMVAIGGSVVAGKHLGEKDNASANAIFTLSLLAILAFTLVMAIFNTFFHSKIFVLLGAPPALHNEMYRYLSVMSFCFVIQLSGMVLYYFIRTDGKPMLGTIALLVGAATNIALDAFFLGYLRWEIEWAAWATTLAQTGQCLILLSFFCHKDRQLHLTHTALKISTLMQALYNGVSEFINEIAVGVVIFTVHWLLLRHSGTNGVAGFAVTNYLLFVGTMIFYGVIDAVHVLISQNFGAKQHLRVQQVMVTSSMTVLSVSLGMVTLAWFLPSYITALFLDEINDSASQHAMLFINLIWPCFIFSGLNLLLSAYFTAIQQPRQSAYIALCRGLFLPVGLLLIFVMLNTPWHFLVALPVAEAMTFVFALTLYNKQLPKQLQFV